jgi:hypothetical protein
MLSMDSPPFNPGRGFMARGGGDSAGNSRSASPAAGESRSSKNNSPVNDNDTTGGQGGGGVVNAPGGTTACAPKSKSGAAVVAAAPGAYSNAIAKHTFQSPTTGEPLEIRNVWADNVEEEMAMIRELLETHPFVAMDTEFPGVVVRPVSDSYTNDYHYKSLKCNVDLLKIIQLGLSFADADGNLAPKCPCWQFNFQFDLTRDISWRSFE